MTKQADKYLLTFRGVKRGEHAAREHNIYTNIPDAMRGESDEALAAFAKLIVIGTRQYAEVESILIEED